MEKIAEFFQSGSFMPHGMCYLWKPEILWLHVISDAVIALSYFSIPIALYLFTKRRKDLGFKSVFYLFTAFILLCGATHLFNIYLVWNPLYGPDGLLKAVTGIVSLITAAMLWKLLPDALAIPGPQHYRDQNELLQSEIESRSEAERESRKLSERLSLATTAGQIGIWEWNPETGKLSWDETMFELYGADPEAFDGSYEFWSKRVYPEDLERVQGKVADVMELGGEFHGMFRVHHPDGQVRHIRTQAQRTGEQGDYRLTGVNYDVSDDIAVREELKQQTAEAQRASRLKSEFLATMSHEIRTPLNGVVGGCQVLQAMGPDSAQQDWLDVIKASSTTLLSLIDDVLDIARIEAGYVTIDQREAELATIVSEAVDTVRGTVEHKGLSIETGEIRNARFNTDPDRLKQILVNLLGNAAKFTEQGSVSVRTIPLDQQTVRFEIVDTGPGIPQEELSNIFERFYQTDGSHTRRHGGAGLGLSIVKNLVELMGGSIAVESEIGRGTTFSVDVPTGGLYVELEPRATAAPVSIPEVDRGPTGRCVLLAEDNELNQRVIEKFLRVDGFDRVDTVTNGRDAFKLACSGEYDLVIMDIQMPEMTGDEAIQRIRMSGTLAARVPIIVVTANALSGAREEYLAAGADAYLSKPVYIEELRGVIGRLVPAA
ncbi:MAG: response regulator [Rhodothermales bacterium]|nr:response regulator [Rhodothermales bacterium]MBO6780332.1 response regulator [Rhodothermales bacterium]